VVGSWSPWWILAELLIFFIALPTLKRLLLSARPREGLTASASLGQNYRISVVIPARNEESRIGPLLAALASAPSVVEVIVVDDESTDGTVQVATQAGATVISTAPRPSGWVGKTWALEQGINAATGDWIVTLDADTRPEPNMPEVGVQWAAARNADLTTVAGSFECPTLGAQAMHAALLTSLVYRYGRPGAIDGSRVIANGQCMVFRRVDVLNLRLMERVRGELIEDVALARSLHRDGRLVEMVDGSDFLRVRMFEDLSSTVRGWGRSISMAGVESRGRLLAQLVEVGCTQVLPLAFVLTGVAPVIGGVLLAIRLGTLVGTARSYPDRTWSYWLSPALDVVAWTVLATGIVRHFVGAKVSWRGRSYSSVRSGL
jgi:dolichol-phosphate mannosyltransferase